MKHEVTTYQTKRLMADALKNEMGKKPLSKITITDIVTDCKLNRKTFYYHFKDIYDLVKWMLQEETISILDQYDLMTDYNEALEFVIEYITTNKHLLACAVDTMGYDLLRYLFANDFKKIIHSILTRTEEEHGLEVSEGLNEFIGDAYVHIVLGILIDSSKRQTKISKEQTIRYISAIREALPAILAKVSEEYEKKTSE